MAAGGALGTAAAIAGVTLMLSLLATAADVAPATAPAAGPTTAPALTAPPPATPPALNAPPAVARPAPQAVPVDPAVLTDDEIGQAIRKGAAFLLPQFDPKTNLISQLDGGAAADASYVGGLDSLVLYALLQSGLALRDDPKLKIDDPGMRAKIEAMKKVDINAGNSQTYAHGLRATCLSLCLTARPETAKRDVHGRPVTDNVEASDRAALTEDAYWCLRATDGGAYSYKINPKAPANLKELVAFYRGLTVNNLPAAGAYDNSNSQYGLLGAWSAAEAGIEIPKEYWMLVTNHWVKCQLGTGQWAYVSMPPSTLSMSCAGLASMFVTYDYLEQGLPDKVGRDPFSPPVVKGLKWFEDKDNGVRIDGGWWGYTLYGVERVGLASGFKHFGQNDWYKILARQIIDAQNKGTGGWATIRDTSYALLFLARGRHPVMMNKLRFDGYWANRPRDAANLATYAGKNLEHPLNWQVVSTATDWTEWTDAPVLEVSSHVAIKFKPEDLAKLRSYAEAGGLIFSQADGDKSEFNTYMTKLGKELFPKYEWENVPAENPIYTSESLYAIRPPIPLKMISNGTRILMLHSPRDITKVWQQRDTSKKNIYQLGMNMFIYGAGKRDLRNRVASVYVPPVTTAPLLTVKVARLQYAGNWDPEPGAWRRYANLFQRNTQYQLEVAPVKLSDLKPGGAAIAHLTGNVKNNFTADEAAAVKAFVEAGGVLFIDQVGGSGPLEPGIQALLHNAFPSGASKPMAPTHPLLSAGNPGMENLSKRKLRDTAVTRIGQGGAITILSAGKGTVINCPLDVTSGLLGTNTVGIVGYDAAYAESLVKNLVFWTLDGQKQ